jgi:undecaprenyl-diphosphatase
MVNAFDSSAALAIDSLVVKWPNVDRAMEFVVGSDLLQGTVAASIFWWYWVRTGTETTVRLTREHLIATLFASIVAIMAGRSLAAALPFRIRPRWEPTLGYIIPSEPDPNVFVNWSSFPSDHAILFAALATGFCFISVRVGVVLFLYYLLVGAFPLMFLGYHYLTDIIAGSMIGLLIALVMNLRAVRQTLSGPMLRWERTSPSSFFVVFFLLTFQIATTFAPLRYAGLALFRFLQRVH